MHLYGVLVAFTKLSKNVTGGYPDIVEGHRAGAGGPDAQLVLWLPNVQARHVTVHNEASDAFVAISRFSIGHDKEHTSMLSVGDPHFGAVDDVIIPIFHSGGPQCKSI